MSQYRSQWTNEDIGFLRALFPNLLLSKEYIENYLDRPWSAITAKARKFKLIRSRTCDPINGFEIKIDKNSNIFGESGQYTSCCWVWKSSLDSDGYGNFWNGHSVVKAHRFSYELYVSKIPNNKQIDHLCRNHTCVNPDHLEAVT